MEVFLAILLALLVTAGGLLMLSYADYLASQYQRALPRLKDMHRSRLSFAQSFKFPWQLLQWILAGAPTARPEPETLGPEHQFTDEERSWWSLQPIRRPEVPSKADPREKNPIDAFVRA